MYTDTCGSLGLHDPAVCTAQDQLDHLIIETTGLADPAPVCITFSQNEEVSEHTTLPLVFLPFCTALRV